LVACHDKRVIHRDIKPENVMLRRDGAPVLIDFGIAHQDGESTGQTQMATGGYAPPEQLAGRAVDATADLYALGMTLAECLGPQAGEGVWGDLINQLTHFMPARRGSAQQLLKDLSEASAQGKAKALLSPLMSREVKSEGDQLGVLQQKASQLLKDSQQRASQLFRDARDAQQKRKDTSALDDYQVASIGKRVRANFIDWMTLFFFFFLGGLFLGDRQEALGGMCILLGFAYQGKQWRDLALSGQTLGKRKMEIKVIKHDRGEEPLGFMQGVVLRSWVIGFFMFVPGINLILFFANCLFVLREDRRCLHDMIAKTRVVDA
jgi:uncharacterized RDD family membrane protein YckC